MDKELTKCIEIICKDFPVFASSNFKHIRSTHSHIIEIDESFIFKFPINTNYNIQREINILDKLAGKTSLSIPKITYKGTSSIYFGYNKLKENALTATTLGGLSTNTRTRIASQLAKFLHEVHGAIKIDEMTKLNIAPDPSKTYPYKIIEALPNMFLDDDVTRFAYKIVHAFETLSPYAGQKMFIYNDLQPSNMIYDSKKQELSAIIDFGFTAIGNAHRDFHQLHKYDPAFLKELIKQYEQLSGQLIDYHLITLFSIIDHLAFLVALFTSRQDLSARQDEILYQLRQWMAEGIV